MHKLFKIRMLTRIIAITILALCSTNLLSQNRTSNWFFGGNIGLKFEEQGISTVDGSQTFYEEGVSSISDINGELLFYTSGEKVWDKNHQLMPNGNGLKGHYSATQSSIIVKQPGNCSLYYIFTLDGKEHGFVNGLNYSIVDMEGHNGLGDIISKNNQLIAPAAEKLAAVKHRDGESIWIICHEMFTDKFYSYLLTNNGLLVNPVISQTGRPFSSIFDGIGQMKISLAGDKLAYTAFVNNMIELFDFDNSSGELSNARELPIDQFEGDGGYGLEFSPNGRYLYFTKFDINYLQEPGSLYQFDLSLTDPYKILNEAIFIGHNKPPSDMRGLQLASNGKIYISNSLSQFLGVISEPDNDGTSSNYINEAQSLNGKYAGWTLPNFVVSYIPEKKLRIEEDMLTISGNCLKEEVVFRYESNKPEHKLKWEFGDGSRSEENAPQHIYENSEQYLVSLIIEDDCQTDTLYRLINIIDCNTKVYIPNAFSPNGDGINDTFKVYGPGISKVEMEIFDRWGEKVFSYTDNSHGWNGKFNGKLMDQAIFVYQVKVEFENKTHQTFKGDVLLINN